MSRAATTTKGTKKGPALQPIFSASADQILTFFVSPLPTIGVLRSPPNLEGEQPNTMDSKVVHIQPYRLDESAVLADIADIVEKTGDVYPWHISTKLFVIHHIIH